MIESDQQIRQRTEAAKHHSYRLRPFDFSRVVVWPDTLKIYRELQQAKAMHDEAMKDTHEH